MNWFRNAAHAVLRVAASPWVTPWWAVRSARAAFEAERGTTCGVINGLATLATGLVLAECGMFWMLLNAGFLSRRFPSFEPLFAAFLIILGFELGVMLLAMTASAVLAALTGERIWVGDGESGSTAAPKNAAVFPVFMTVLLTPPIATAALLVINGPFALAAGLASLAGLSVLFWKVLAKSPPRAHRRPPRGFPGRGPSRPDQPPDVPSLVPAPRQPPTLGGHALPGS